MGTEVRGYDGGMGDDVYVVNVGAGKVKHQQGIGC